MRLPVYNYDMELLTVVHLAPWAVDLVEKTQSIALTIEREIPTLFEQNAPVDHRTWFVTLRAFEIAIGCGRHYRARSWFLVCGDETHALLLKSCFAPGQQREVRDREKEAFGKGIRKAFGMLGGMMGDQQ